MHFSHLKTRGFSCSTLGSFDVGGTSSDTWVKRDMNEEHYYWQQHPLLFHDDIHIHRCIDETSLIHLKSSCFLCSLLGSYFGGIYSFASCMKEHMADYYFDAYYIIWEQHYRTRDPHLCHWSRFNWSFEACMHLAMVVYLLGGISTFMIF